MVTAIGCASSPVSSMRTSSSDSWRRAARRARLGARPRRRDCSARDWRSGAAAPSPISQLEEFAQAEIARLEDARLSALEDRVEAELELGRPAADLVGELQGLVARYPLRERLRAASMLALYRCGRQTDALAVFDDARRTLVETLGLEPGPGLQQLTTPRARA